MNFIAINFETANSSRASICSIGLVKVGDGANKRKASVKDSILKARKSHPFFNATIVFTGKLQSMTRGEASQRALACGGICKNSVTKDTNYLVIGDYNLTSFTEIFSSTKMRKAEEMINKGHLVI